MERLKFYGSIAFFASFDLVTGTAIAYLVNSIFKLPDTVGSLEEYDTTKWLKMVLELGIQALLTLFIGIELRNLFVSVDDPTGGLLFILSVFRQPSFWARVDVLSRAIYNLVMGDVYPSLFQPS
jgi:hypothetical protein